MGQFAGTLFSALLGWVQLAASWLWGLIANADVSAWFRWLLDNWLPLTLILCAAGVVIDFLVYLLRWQPYRVWRSFLHRVTAKDALPAPEETVQPLFQRKWVYADGSTSLEDVRDPLQEQHAQLRTEQLEAPVRPMRRVARHSALEEGYNQPVYPLQWQQNSQDQQGDNE